MSSPTAQEIAGREYQAGFVTDIESESIPPGLSEDIIRYLTIRVDELEEGPSAMMRKVDRDRERDDGRPGGGPRGDRGGDRFRDRERRPPRDDDEAPAEE